MATKNQIAMREYGCNFDELSPGEKATVTRKFNAQTSPSSRPARQVGVKGTIGRVGENGTKTCILVPGATVDDLLEQSGYHISEDKESIVAESTGETVSLSDEVENGETYMIAPEVESA
ncbi:hypothetical protein [Oceanihabitans sediminis]|uniref:hypothetical protein n=1 Tax=Oceanihabitans sediminis TaxID=1812012 RepID=UPI00299DE8C3|nr:hypothetical protein [Oceanihabitans sediminis]MDX1279245.1 hypothetical protein [Oceanihabitans sediminis]